MGEIKEAGNNRLAFIKIQVKSDKCLRYLIEKQKYKHKQQVEGVLFHISNLSVERHPHTADKNPDTPD
jgi:hypothetical protein